MSDHTTPPKSCVPSPHHNHFGTHCNLLAPHHHKARRHHHSPQRQHHVQASLLLCIIIIISGCPTTCAEQQTTTEHTTTAQTTTFETTTETVTTAGPFVLTECWECTQGWVSPLVCNQTATLVTCPTPGQSVCYTEVRNQNGILGMRKGCRNRQSCSNNAGKNDASCGIPDIIIKRNKQCAFCCENENQCNYDQYTYSTGAIEFTRQSLYPFSGGYGDSNVTCAGGERFCSTSLIEISPLYIEGVKFKFIQVNTNGYVAIGNIDYRKRQPIDWANLFNNQYRSTAVAKGLAILAPLWADNDFNNPAYPDTGVMYQQYDRNLRFGSQDRNLVDSVLKQAQTDVLQYTGFSEFIASWVMVVTWESMYPRVLYDSAQDGSNTYQLIIISDSLNKKSVALYIYRQTSWNSVSYIRNSQIGTYIVSGDVTKSFTSTYSNTGNAFQLDRITFTSTADNGIRAGILSNLPHVTVDYEQKCFDWYAASSSVAATKILDTQFSLTKPCPCDLSLLLEEDWEFNQPQFNADNTRNCYYERVQLAQAATECCFDISTSALLTAADGASGNKLLFHPSYTQSHRDEDVNPKLWCCVHSSYCNIFYQLRPIDTCSGYTSPTISWMMGDPHIVTLDGLEYTFNGLGQYVLLKTLSSDFQIQGQTKRAIDTNGQLVAATSFSGFAAKDYNSDLIQIVVGSQQNGFEIFLHEVNVTDWFYSSANGANKKGDAASLVRSNDTVVLAKFRSGFAITVTFLPQFGGILNILVTAPSSAYNRTMGLLGRLNNDTTDDFMLPDGSFLDVTSTENQIYTGFGQLWQVTQISNSIFFDKANFDATQSFTPVFFDPNSVPTEVKNACEGIKSCMYDSAVTNDLQAGLSTLKTSKSNVLIKQNLENIRPTVSGPHLWNVTFNVTNSLLVNLSDADGDAIGVMLKVVPPVTDNSIYFDMSTETLYWNPTNSTPVTITLLANDSKGGVSAQYSPTINFCFCLNGICVDNPSGDVSSNEGPFRLLECTCDKGWAGPDCSLDNDACSNSPCLVIGSNRTCIDLTPSEEQQMQRGFNCSACDSGFLNDPNDMECIDIDECTGNHGCDTVNGNCLNVPGSFNCSCNDNYKLNRITQLCDDIDECTEGVNDCSQHCNNTKGGYFCECLPGYELQADGITCNDTLNVCGSSALSCTNGCMIDQGQPTCFCPNGYQLAANLQTCIDLNECELGLDKCSQVCENLPGRYRCSCQSGYVLQGDQTTCLRCPLGTWGVDCQKICRCANANTKCLPATGCIECSVGYVNTGECTQDINECLTNPCDKDAICKNTVGSFKCTCLPGKRLLNTTHCAEVLECQSNPCLNNGECVDRTNSYECVCVPGTTGVSCETDIDECASTPCQNGGNCQNGNNKFRCTCVGHWMGLTCEIPVILSTTKAPGPTCMPVFVQSEVIHTYAVTMRLTDRVFTIELTVVKSPEYKQLTALLQFQMEEVFGCNARFADVLVEVRNFQYSAPKADSGLMVSFLLDLASERTEEEIRSTLVAAARNNNLPFNIDTSSIQAPLFVALALPSWAIVLISFAGILAICIVAGCSVWCMMGRKRLSHAYSEKTRLRDQSDQDIPSRFGGSMHEPADGWAPMSYRGRHMWQAGGTSLRSFPEAPTAYDALREQRPEILPRHHRAAPPPIDWGMMQHFAYKGQSERVGGPFGMRDNSLRGNRRAPPNILPPQDHSRPQPFVEPAQPQRLPRLPRRQTMDQNAWTWKAR